VQWRSVRAPILARRGAQAEAEALARAALALAFGAEVPLLLAEAHADLAQVLVAAARPAEARDGYMRAAEVSLRKGDLVSAARAQAAAAAL